MKFTNALGGCANCGALTSPCWRKGPEEAKHLCNACGSRYLVKGTLEGYKPGLKNRTGGKRPKSTKSKPFPTSLFQDPAQRDFHSDSPQKRTRLFKDHSRSFVDKGIQVNSAELEGMQPFNRTHSMDEGSDEAYLDSSSPKSHFDRIKQEGDHGGYHHDHAGGVEMKDSSDESSPEAEVINGGGSMTGRRRARKPCRPTVSTW